MTSRTPSLRSDLILREQQSADGPCVVVKDPHAGDFFRFGEVELFILRQLDGKTSLREIRRRTESQFGATLSEETLSAFIRKLSRAGLLEDGARTSQPGKRLRPGGSLLFYRIPLFDPARVFDYLEPRTRFFFTRAFVWFSVALIAVAGLTLMTSWGAFALEFPRLYQLSSIPVFVVIVFLLIMAHEFAHGMACRHYGGEVREIGFLLIYFQPAMYCNVSDAWLFPERWKRLWVGAAGPYFELVLWAVAVLVWRITAFDTAINYLALIVMTGSGVKTLLNFNPLIKLDGYYLLGDWVEIPNLRKKSFRYVGDTIKRLTGWSEAAVVQPNARERRIYLIYGSLATVYSFTLLALISLKMGDVLIERGEPVALALVGGLMSTRFRHRVRGLMGKGTEEDDADDEEEPVAPRNGERRQGSEREQRKARERTRRYVWLALLAGLVLVLFAGSLQLRVSGPVTALPQAHADVRARVEGIVEEIYVDEGDEVAVGDRIARLASEALVTSLRTTEAEIRESEAVLKRMERGPRAAELAISRAAVSAAADRAAHARARLARIAELEKERVVTRAELDDVQAQATAAANELTEATRRLDLLRIGTRPEDIEAERAQLDRLEASRRHLEEQVARLEITSPVAGIVATPSRQLQAMKQQLVSKGGVIAKVYDYKTVAAQFMIAEKDIAEVQVGQRVELRARALPNLTFHGRVTAVAIASEAALTPTPSAPPASGAGGRGQNFIVTTQLDNSSMLLKPGMTGQAKVFCGDRRIINLITRRIVRTLKIEVWSWW